MTLVLVALLLGAPSAGKPPVGVVIGKRSGVSAPLALARAGAVRSALGQRFAEAPIDDFTACASKRPCLTKEAQAREWKALVVVETATILNDALVKVSVLSIDDDGREVAAASVQRSDAQLPDALAGSFKAVNAELERLLPARETTSSSVVEPVVTAEPVVEPVAKDPAPVTPAPQPPSVRQAPAARPFARWLPAAGGVVLLGLGAGFAIASQGLASRLKSETFTDSALPTTLAQEGALLQTLGGALLGTGAAITLGGVLLALLWPDAPVAPVTFFTSNAAGLAMVGVFP